MDTMHRIELGDDAFWAAPMEEREAAFAALRRSARAGEGMTFNEEISVLPGAPKGNGFWSAVTYDDVRAVSRDQARFSSAKGIVMRESAPEMLDGASIIVMDDPRHTKFRRLVQGAFTPRMVASLEGSVRTRARRLVEAAREQGGSCDFVEAFAAPLPLQVICDMLSVPAEDEWQIFTWTNAILGVGDEEMVTDYQQLIDAADGMRAYAEQLAEDHRRRTSGGSDIISALLEAEVDGHRLSLREFGNFFMLLAIAGNETTRNAISWGMHLLTTHPDQRERLRADFATLAIPAVDEIVRWASPVMHMRRTALEDVEVANTKVSAGDKVIMWYWSANRDEGYFDNPASFDIARPNSADMVGFGSAGTHFCLGANLARREIQVMFDEILTSLPDLETGEPERLLSNFINGIKRMPCQFTP